SLTTLGDDDVGTVLGCEFSLAYGGDLLHGEAADFVHTMDQVSCVIERKRNHRGGRLERRGKGIRIEIRHDVIHRKGTIRQLAKLSEVAGELVRWTVPGTETAKRAGVADRRCQRGRCEDAHPRLDERNLDAHETTQG